MHKNSKLDWQQLSWQDFQTLSLHLAQNLVPDCNFEIYLKEGHKQDGIDVISSIGDDGKHVLIQCKNKKSLDKTEIQNIVDRFISESFVKKASTFILATAADLQKPALQQFIFKIKEKLFKELKIKFETWDDTFINEQLRSHKTLVQFYFNERIATDHCFPFKSIEEKPKNEPIPNFIQRKVCLFSESEDQFNNVWGFHQRDKFFLPDIIRKNRLSSKHICLIADPHQGKTFLLTQTTWELENGTMPFQCLFIQIKSHKVRSIRKLLDEQYSFWQQIPFKDLVIVLDGLDEVSTDKFDEAIRNIAEFRQAFPFITVVFSCRKLFYNRFNVKTTIKEFSVYDLYPLQDYDVIKYLKDQLGTQYDKFDKAASKAGIYKLFNHPFYLTNLVKNFKKPPYKLPSSKIKVIEKFVDDSHNITYERRISGGRIIQQKSVKFRITIQKFALALQLAGLNALPEEDMQMLFDDSEIELLEHNSLISISGSSWSFTNALFQEHLAAMMLVKMDFSKTLSFITVGIKVRKIKTKWIQTIASLLSILEEDDPLSKKLLEFIDQDNIELLFTTEKSKFTEEIRFEATKKLINKCIKHDLRPMLVYEETIALFIDGDKKSIDFLLEKLNNRNVTERIKTAICYILKNLSSPENLESKILSIVKKEISKTSDPFYAKQLVEVIEAFNIGNEMLVNELIHNTKLNSYHEYRSGLYSLIASLDLVDKFYQFGIEGVKHLIHFNQGISRGGSEYSLHTFLLSIKNSTQLQLLFNKLLEDDWINFNRHHSLAHEEFLKKLTTKTAEIFKTEPQVIFIVINYIQNLDRRSIRDEFKEIDEFFEKTNSDDLTIRILIDKFLGDPLWELNNLIKPESFDYLLFEFEERPLSTKILWNWISGLRYCGKHDIAAQLFAICDAAVEGFLTKESQESPYNEYEKNEQQKRSNDVAYIQDREKFKEGVKKFFEAYGNKSIPEEDIFVEYDGPSIRKKFDSNFISGFLIKWISKNKKISLNSALKVINNNDSFRFFRASEILHYKFAGTPGENILKGLLEEYYKTEIETAKFENCIVEHDKGYTYLRKEKLLGQIFEKFEFETAADKLMSMVWLDGDGVKSFEHHELNKQKSLSQLIIQHLSEYDLITFRQQIVNNIKAGIKSESILGTHVGLCKHLNISEARDLILDIVNNKKLRNWSITDYMDVYLHLGGNSDHLVPYFKKIKDYTDYTYFYLVKKLSLLHSAVVKDSLLTCLQSIAVGSDIKVETAKYLVSLGSNEGFVYLIDRLKLDKKAPYTIQGNYKVTNIDTHFGLNLLKDLIFILLDPEYYDVSSFHDSPRSLLIEWLSDFSEKSETDLNAVLKLLNDSYNKLKSRYPNAKDIMWHAERMVEKFRDSDKTIKTVKEIKPILDSLS